MSALAERQSVTKTRLTPAPCNAATRLWPGAKSVIVEPCSANGAQRRLGIPSQAVEKSRSRTVGSSSATQFCVVHCRSRALVGGWFNREVCELPRRGRGNLTRGFGNERRPQESRACELRTVQSIHRHKLKSDWNLRIALDQKSGALSAAFQAEPARSVVERCRKKSGHFHLCRLFTRWVQHHAGYGIDPGQMIVDGLYARRVFGRYHDRLALSFIGD